MNHRWSTNFSHMTFWWLWKTKSWTRYFFAWCWFSFVSAYMCSITSGMVLLGGSECSVVPWSVLNCLNGTIGCLVCLWNQIVDPQEEEQSPLLAKHFTHLLQGIWIISEKVTGSRQRAGGSLSSVMEFEKRVSPSVVSHGLKLSQMSEYLFFSAR